MSGQVIVCNVRKPFPEGFTPIYVGRRTSYRKAYSENFSVLGNLYAVQDYSRETAVGMYREYLDERLRAAMPNDIQVAMDELCDRVRAGEKLALMCFCAPQACHADVIKEILENNC